MRSWCGAQTAFFPAIGAIAVVAMAASCTAQRTLPPDTEPAGAYGRIVLAIAEGRTRDVFPYLEDEAQWACYTIQKERAAALARAEKSYPAGELAGLAGWNVDAEAPDGADVFVRLGKSRGYFVRLARDLSGVARVEQDGDRATIVTGLGTRYPMHKRQNGMWGLTWFTAELAADAERATRDRLRVEQAANDYDLANGKGAPNAAN